jgi:putative Mg2+ transporter-C (MgtC) family protein
MTIEFIPEDLFKVILAVTMGAMIGVEREYRNKSAGFRTIMLITLASAIFTILSARIAPDNPDRIAANILTGLGFLGAGVMFRDDNRMNGITTAASIWSAAAIGMAIGSGHYGLAVASTAIILMILLGMVGIERLVDRRNRVRKYKIVCDYQKKTLHHYEAIFEKYGLIHQRGIQSRIAGQIIGNWIVMGAEEKHERLVNYLLSDPGVKEFDF